MRNSYRSYVLKACKRSDESKTRGPKSDHTSHYQLSLLLRSWSLFDINSCEHKYLAWRFQYCWTPKSESHMEFHQTLQSLTKPERLSWVPQQWGQHWPDPQRDSQSIVSVMNTLGKRRSCYTYVHVTSSCHLRPHIAAFCTPPCSRTWTVLLSWFHGGVHAGLQPLDMLQLLIAWYWTWSNEKQLGNNTTHWS